MEKEINRLTNRHIGKLLTKLDERYNLEDDIKEAIKAHFRGFSDDIKNNVGKVKNERESRLD